MKIRKLQKRAHATATEKGWWEDRDPEDEQTVLACLALVHSEISEAVEAVRDEGVHSRVEYIIDNKPLGLAVELADAVIRIADLCEAIGIDLDDAIEAKMEYNETRLHRHGGKKA
jgi:NTP pyrophosphatase (non-canonical NTP hydrolase)